MTMTEIPVNGMATFSRSFFMSVLAWWLISGPAQAGQAPKTLCLPGEQVLFNCTIKGPNKKILSICGSKNLAKDAGWLQYRFGTTRAVELKFPKEHANSRDVFTFTHFSRANADVTTLDFETQGASYSVQQTFESDDGSEVPGTPKAEGETSGVQVTRKGAVEGSGQFIACVTPAGYHLNRLQDVFSERASASQPANDSEAPGKGGASEMKGGQAKVLVSAQEQLSQHVGNRITLVARTSESAGQYLASPPATHPVVTHVLLGDYKMAVFSKVDLPQEMQNCTLWITGTLEKPRGPVKSGGSSGRIYEPLTWYQLIVDEWECATTP